MHKVRENEVCRSLDSDATTKEERRSSIELCSTPDWYLFLTIVRGRLAKKQITLAKMQATLIDAL